MAPSDVEIGFHIGEMSYGKNEGTIDFAFEGRMQSVAVTYSLKGALVVAPSGDVRLVPSLGQSMTFDEELLITSVDKDGLPWNLTTTSPAIVASALQGVTPSRVTLAMKMSELDSRSVETICFASPYIEEDSAKIYGIRILSSRIPTEKLEAEARLAARQRRSAIKTFQKLCDDAMDDLGAVEKLWGELTGASGPLHNMLTAEFKEGLALLVECRARIGRSKR